MSTSGTSDIGSSRRYRRGSRILHVSKKQRQIKKKEKGGKRDVIFSGV